MNFPVAPSVAIALLVSGVPLAAQAAPGRLMDMTVTSKVTMPGMPAQSPHTSRYKTCAAADRPDPKAMFQGMGCTVTKFKQVGDDVSGRVECPGPPPMAGEGHYTWSGRTFHGQFHLTGSAEGQTVSADNTVDGRQVGACDYTPR